MHVMSAWTRRLLVVEDEPLMGSLLDNVLTSEGFDVRLCVDAASAREALEEFDPDGALIDINLGAGPNGLHLGHVLKRTAPHVGLIFLTKYADLRAAGLDHWDVPEGAAFLSKDLVGDTAALLATINDSLGGAKSERRDDKLGVDSLDGLTRTQLHILRLAALGYTNSAIARQRSTNERNVEQRLQSVYQTLEIPVNSDINPRVEAVRRYIKAVGLPPEPDETGPNAK